MDQEHRDSGDGKPPQGPASVHEGPLGEVSPTAAIGRTKDEHHTLGNICIKCDEPFTPDHPRARGAQGILGTGSAMGLNVLSGGKAEVGPVHENNERCQATAEKKGRAW